MTEVEFHVNVGDKLEYSCRLLRKAHAGGAKLLVTADPVMLAQLDQTVHQQAYLMAYSDAFYVSCVALAVCALASLLLRQHAR